MKLPKRWVIAHPDPETVLRLSNALAISEPLARVLVARGFQSPAETAAFLDADFEILENPFQMADMEKAVNRLGVAAERDELVFVAGDRDVDGVTSTTLLVQLLKALSIRHDWKVPAPEDGYGLSAAAVEAAAAAGASLILAVDCGIRDFDGVNLAREKDIDVVILDHHEPDVRLPEAFAVVDPKRADCPYPFKHLCACGVAFKFAQAVLMSKDKDVYGHDLVVFDLVTSEVEAEGTDKRVRAMIEIAGIRSRHGVETGRFQSLIRPAVASSSVAAGMTEEMMAAAPSIAEVIPEFLEFANGAALDSRRVTGDVHLLKEAATALSLTWPDFEIIDTLALAPNRRAWKKLPDTPRAMTNAEACFATLRRLMASRNTLMQSFLKDTLDLVGMATLADVVPLRGENRVLVRRGLEAITRSTRPGMVALREVFVRGGAVTAKDVGWSLAPAINAAGRLGKAHLSAQLLLSSDLEMARRGAVELATLNDERKKRVKVNVAAVAEVVDREFDPERDAALVVTIAGIEHGVTGIVANRLMYDIGRPVVLLIEDDGDVWKGTSRSIPGLDITKAFHALTDVIAHFGGHSAAAGIAVRPGDVPAFRERLSAYVRGLLTAEDLTPSLRIDAELRPSEVGEKLVKELARLEPTGNGNEHPVFYVRGMEAVDVRRMGDSGQHLKLQLRRNGIQMEAVSWNATGDDPEVGSLVDAAFTMERNEWQGRARIQCVLTDWRAAA